MKTTASTSLLLLSALAFSQVVVIAQSGRPDGRPDTRPRAQRGMAPPRPVAPPQPGRPRFGDPLAGLTAAQLAAFAQGRAEFENRESPEGGLGPIFNNSSCHACHASGATGGGGPVTVTRFGRNTPQGFDPLTELGGPLLQMTATDFSVQEIVPFNADVVAHRQSTPLFGLGLIEAIPDATIISNAQRLASDGVRGKFSAVLDPVSNQPRVGRFGWKAQQATLLAFSADAYLNEMGVTSRIFPVENAPNGNADLLAALDNVADPEDTVDPATGKSDIDASADFMQLLAPPPPLPLTAGAAAGSRIFHQSGCAVCHLPSMTTGLNPIAALSLKPVPLYSDLLLHDMGELGDGIPDGTAGPRDMRTPPLWGLRASAPYLHDGRAATVDAAIKAHDGEARIARDRYLRLRAMEQRQLTEFLNSL
jgi:CxxC motif-containing protein (DUF1111 family)